MLGGGAIIGDMSVRESAGGAPRRTATVVALTELVTYKVPLKEFKRRMPADVLEVRGLELLNMSPYVCASCWPQPRCMDPGRMHGLVKD
jgi:CRP-like cAMP-binding protein